MTQMTQMMKEKGAWRGVAPAKPSRKPSHSPPRLGRSALLYADSRTREFVDSFISPDSPIDG